MKNNNNKKDVSTNELARMMAKGFSDVNDKLIIADRKIDKLDSRVDKLNGKMDKLIDNLFSFREEVRLEFKRLWAEVDYINQRLDKIEKNNVEEIELLSGDIVKLKSKVSKLEKKINKLKLAN